MSLFEIPHRACPVTQEQLETLISLSNAQRKVAKELGRLKTEILKALLNGAVPEPGIHFAEIEERTENGKRIQKLRVY